MKVYNGIELLKAAKDGEIKEGDMFKLNNQYAAQLFFDGYTFRWDDDNAEILKVDIFTCFLFTLIEENQDIDIQSIEEIDAENYSYNTELTIAILEQQNQMLKWAKQLDRKINNN